MDAAGPGAAVGAGAGVAGWGFFRLQLDVNGVNKLMLLTYAAVFFFLLAGDMVDCRELGVVLAAKSQRNT